MVKENSIKINALTFILMTIYLLLLSWIILFKMQFFIPVIPEGRVLNLIPFQGSFNIHRIIRNSEIRNNIIIFMPLGIYISILKFDWGFFKKVFAIFALTFGFEAAQFIFIIGRADITDILGNTFGGIIGIVLYAILFKLTKSKANNIILALAAIITFLTLLIISFLLITDRWIHLQ